MKPLPFATPEEEPEPVWIPEERGQLLPPARRPPTAVGTAAPRPRDRSEPPIPPKVSRLTRIAHSMFGTGLLVGGFALATLPVLAAALGVGVALLGADVIARAATDRGLIIAWRSRGGRRHHLMRGESTTRSLRRSAQQALAPGGASCLRKSHVRERHTCAPQLKRDPLGRSGDFQACLHP